MKTAWDALAKASGDLFSLEETKAKVQTNTALVKAAQVAWSGDKSGFEKLVVDSDMLALVKEAQLAEQAGGLEQSLEEEVKPLEANIEEFRLTVATRVEAESKILHDVLNTGLNIRFKMECAIQMS